MVPAGRPCTDARARESTVAAHPGARRRRQGRTVPTGIAWKGKTGSSGRDDFGMKRERICR